MCTDTKWQNLGTVWSWPIWRRNNKFCKAPPNPLDKMATREHKDEMIRVKECFQDQHGFESQEECPWALKPPTDIEGFVSCKIWAIARVVGDTSDVRKVEKQRLDLLLLDEARAK